MDFQTRVRRLLDHSRQAITDPSIATFRSMSLRGNDADAFLYVALGGLVTVLLGMLLGGGINPLGILSALLNQLFAFYIFVGVIFLIGQQRGGLGSFGELAYSFSLFYVPITLAVWLLAVLLAFLPVRLPLQPWLISLVALVAQAFYAQRAVQAGMGFRSAREAWLTVGVGLLALWLIQLVFSRAGSFGF